jgi:hypothetical protein
MVCRSHSSSLAESSKTKKFSPFWNICSRINNEFMKTMNPKEIENQFSSEKVTFFCCTSAFQAPKLPRIEKAVDKRRLTEST